MRTEKFKILQFIRELIISIDKEMINFPKKDIELKNRIRSNSYDILELVYEANATFDNKDKIKLLQKAVAKLKIIDFLLNISLDKEIITQKRYIKFGNRIDDILKYISGLINSLVKNS